MTIEELTKNINRLNKIIELVEEKLDDIEMCHLDRVDSLRKIIDKKQNELCKIEQTYRDMSGECSFCQNTVTKADGRYECQNCRD
jgi:hypothetical protein